MGIGGVFSYRAIAAKLARTDTVTKIQGQSRSATDAAGSRAMYKPLRAALGVTSR